MMKNRLIASLIPTTLVVTFFLGLLPLPSRAGSDKNQPVRQADQELMRKRAHTKLAESLDEAIDIVESLRATRTQKGIPSQVIQQAKGIAVLEITKAGFGVSGSGGSGVLIIKTPKGWSPPIAIDAGGFGIGPQLGVSIMKVVMILNTQKSIEMFTQESRLSIGAEANAIAGPSHAEVESSTLPLADIYTYRKTDGAFIGASLQGSFLDVNKNANRKFYGSRTTVQQLLSGTIATPPEAQELYQALGVKPLR